MIKPDMFKAAGIDVNPDEPIAVTKKDAFTVLTDIEIEVNQGAVTLRIPRFVQAGKLAIFFIYYSDRSQPFAEIKDTTAKWIPS